MEEWGTVYGAKNSPRSALVKPEDDLFHELSKLMHFSPMNMTHGGWLFTRTALWQPDKDNGFPFNPSDVPVTGDVTRDYRVGFDDFVQFARGFGGVDSILDFNGNGVVDFPDFVVLAQNFGRDQSARKN